VSNDSTIPRGLCQCGCGEKTKLAYQNNTRLGWVLGQPISYINGHQGRSKLSDEARFWLYVDKSGGLDSCWLWTGECVPGGYGYSWFAGKTRGTHIIAWFLAHGEWATQNVLHHCDYKPCTNPAHLFQGTQLDNMRDKVQKNRQAKGARIGIAKLNSKKVRNIRKLYAKGWPQHIIAEHYSVHQATISCIITGKTWTHVI
jgi:hypothetical protein